MTTEPSKQGIGLEGAVWMTAGGVGLGGKGRMELLSKVADLGSITQAAKAFGMSYKAAWDAIDNMNNLVGEPLVERQVGGKGGGGTRLTRRGQNLVDNFRILEREHRRFVEELRTQAADLASDYLLIRRLGMKTSARNQFQGTIDRLKVGAVNTEVQVNLPGGGSVSAIVTNESGTEMGLERGMPVTAIFKSSSVIIGVPA